MQIWAAAWARQWIVRWFSSSSAQAPNPERGVPRDGRSRSPVTPQAAESGPGATEVVSFVRAILRMAGYLPP